MILRRFLVGSAIALGASALLVIPEVDTQPVAPPNEMNIRPVEAAAATRQDVVLSCTECPFREVDENGKVSWVDGFDTSLSLNFTIENGFLLANGRPIFPPPPPTHLTATQRRLSDGAESEPIELGYAVEMMPVPTPPDEPMDMVAIRFTILDLDHHPVPLDTVAIRLIHDSASNLYLAEAFIEKSASPRISWRQCRGRPRCLRRLLIHRIRGLFFAAKMRMLGLAPKFDCGAGPQKIGNVLHQPHHNVVVAEGGRERLSHSHHHIHWQRTLARIVRFIIIPAILGVLAGLVASALGMLVGQIIVFLWHRFRRSSRSSSKKSEESGTKIEKQGLMNDSTNDLPPAYNDEEAGTDIDKN